MFAVLIVQADAEIVLGYRRDGTVRSVGVSGFANSLAGSKRFQFHRASCVLAQDYGTVGWSYMPKGSCVVRLTQRIRWVMMPEPDPALLSGKLLYVDEIKPGGMRF